MKKIRVLSIVLTLFMMALIFFFSSQNSTDSAQLSGGVTRNIVEFFVGILNLPSHTESAWVDMLHGFVRKAAHFSIYAALGFCSAFALKSNTKCDTKRILIYAVLFCMLYAVSDEIHQLFVGGRACRAFDVFIDTVGATVGSVCFIVIPPLCVKFRNRNDWWILITIFIMAAIVAFSSQTSDRSNDLSKAVSGKIADAYNFIFCGGEKVLTVSDINHVVRKSAHFFIYLALGCFTTIMMMKKGKYKVHTSWLCAVIISSAYAAADEFHQIFVSGRGPMITDVRLDMMGALTGATIYVLYHMIRTEISCTYRRRYDIQGKMMKGAEHEH